MKKSRYKDPDYMVKYRATHKEEKKEYDKKNHLRDTESRRIWRENNKEKISSQNKEWYLENRESALSRSMIWQLEQLSAWEKYLPDTMICQCCTYEIVFNKKDVDNSVHFDHRHEGIEPISGSPYNWLRNNKCTKENIELFNSCDFGRLCGYCNRYLPTLKRKSHVLNSIKYVFGIEITEDDLMCIKKDKEKL